MLKDVGIVVAVVVVAAVIAVGLFVWAMAKIMPK